MAEGIKYTEDYINFLKQISEDVQIRFKDTIVIEIPKVKKKRFFNDRLMFMLCEG